MSRQGAVREATPLIPGLGAKVVVDFATALDAATRAALSELFQRHHLTSEIKTPRGERLATHGPDLLAAKHRIVDYRPGKPTPYVTANIYQTDCVLGMDAATSRALLDEVYAILYDERHVYEHSWKNGDFVVWDNRIVHHARGDLSNVGARTLRRFTAGGAPSVEQIPWPQRETLQKNFRARLGPDGKPRAEAGAG